MFKDAQPVHQVHLSGFWIDIHEVTNEEFAKFVEATGYRTVAERTLNAEDFPHASPDSLLPGGLVFRAPNNPVSKRNYWNWWQYVHGADWRHPEGPRKQPR